jgi:TonB-linked SusC/RagA family outer membrane protein
VHTRAGVAGAVAAFLFAAGLSSTAAQQTGSVTGVITNRQGGTPVVGAQVYLQNTRYGAVSDQTGRFSIVNVGPGTYTLIVRYLGFADARHANLAVRTGEGTPVTVQLEPTVLPIQELVVTGVTDPIAGIKSPVTVARVGVEQLQVPTTGSAMSAIAGKVAGASVIRQSGQPGQGVSILLRTGVAAEGLVQLEPLFVVDGVILARSVGDTDTDIDPADIESIEVIKGAAASSMYGSRAAAGVISITTRRGKSTPIGQTRINYRSELGQDFIGREMPLSNHHHYRMNAQRTQFVDANGGPVTWSNRTTDPARRIADLEFPGQLYNNVRTLFRPDRVFTQNMTLSQNTDKTSFFIALNRLDQRGALAGNEGYWRNQGRLSLDHRLGDQFSIALTALHSRSWQDSIVGGNPYQTGLSYPPFVNLAKKGPDGQYVQQPDSSVTTENPLWLQTTRDNFGSRARTQASANARYSPINWLTLDAQLSYDRADANSQIYVPKGTPTSTTEDIPSDGTLEMSNQRVDSYNGSIAATALRQFGELAARATFRATMEREVSESFDAEGTDFIVRRIRDLSAAGTLDDIFSETSDIRANGFMVNVGADFKDRYVFDGLLRRDGSSLFGPTERWQTYYRAAGSYLVSRESWFNLPRVDELSLRYSIGTAGTRPRFNQQYELWNVSRTNGLTRNSAGNSQLKPQFTTEQEFGITSILFSSKLSVELVYARQTTKDQIIGLPVPTISGFNTVVGNAGTVTGNTFEITLNAPVINRRDLTLSLTAVADRSRNKITEWGRACFFGHTIASELSNHEYSCAGEQRGDFWGARHIRAVEELPSWLQSRAAEFQTNDEGYLVWVGTGNSYTEGLSKNLWGSSIQAGGATYFWGEPILLVDANNIPVFVKMGSSLPDLNYGFTANLRWKNASLYGEFRGQLGGKVYNAAKQALYNQLRHGDLDQTGKSDELKKPIDYYQRALYAGNRFALPFIESGTYLKVGALTARYRFPRTQLARLLGTMAPNDVTFGVTGRNLLTLTGYSGFDPETGRAQSRVETLGYPQLRTVTATLEITF